jgi:hypothetical protein
MGTMFIKTSGKNKIEMVESSKRGFTGDESAKLETEV